MDRFDEMRARKMKVSDGKICNVFFDTGEGSSVPTQKIVEGYQAKSPEAPLLEGSKFDCWLLNDAVFDFSTPITEDITLTAKWMEQIINYKMLYDGSINSTENWSEETGGFFIDNQYNGQYSTFNKNSNNMHIRSSSSDYTSWVNLFTTNVINLTDYALICAYVKLQRKDACSNALVNYIRVKDTNDFSSGTIVSEDTVNTTARESSTTMSTQFPFFMDCNIEKISYGYPFVATQGGHTLSYIYDIFLLKQDNWQELCSVAGLISSDYTDEATLCSNSDAINTILQNEEAVNYMLFFCTGTFMYNFIINSSNITAINSSPYYDTIYNNVHWKKFLNIAIK